MLEAPIILRFLGKVRPAVDPLPDPEEPIRTELFSVERLEQHAESLASAQRVTANPRRGRRLLPRLVDNGRPTAAYGSTTAAELYLPFFGSTNPAARGRPPLPEPIPLTGPKCSAAATRRRRAT